MLVGLESYCNEALPSARVYDGPACVGGRRRFFEPTAREQVFFKSAPYIRNQGTSSCGAALFWAETGRSKSAHRKIVTRKIDQDSKKTMQCSSTKVNKSESA